MVGVPETAEHCRQLPRVYGDVVGDAAADGEEQRTARRQTDNAVCLGTLSDTRQSSNIGFTGPPHDVDWRFSRSGIRASVTELEELRDSLLNCEGDLSFPPPTSFHGMHTTWEA